MKRKETAGILALFLGAIGIHRFYLGQVGLGVLYILLSFLGGLSIILGIIDAIVFLSMDQDSFDIKYNPEYFKAVRRDREKDDPLKRYWHEPRPRQVRERPDYQRARPVIERQQARAQPRPPARKPNPHKAAGVARFKDFDYDAAIAEFKKALEIEPKDIATHFNLACAYSLNELPAEAFEELDRAVALGFNDFERIRTHDALAFLRIQPGFEDFEARGFRLENSTAEEATETPESEQAEEENNLLEQLKKLGELKEKGLLSDEEFSAQKKKLLR